MSLYSVKPRFRRALLPVAQRLARKGVSPDGVTAAGLVFAGVAGLAIWAARGVPVLLLVVPVAVLLRTAANALDGQIAGLADRARPLGEVFNEVADRFGDAAVFLSLLAYPGVPDALVAVTVAAMLISSYLGIAVRAAGGRRLYDGLMAKPDRMLVVGIAAVIAFAWADPADTFTVALWVVLVGVVLTLVRRAGIARKELG